MKKIKMGLMALAAVSSIGSAFAFSPTAKPNALTYYAVSTENPSQPNSFFWTTTQPADKDCTAGSVGICTIVTNTAPTNNVVPSTHTSESDKGIYR
ncbi:hypothetical protein DIU31_028295 [Mucilaginibacter rubeus]|uniref:Secreted protein n=1 Tax=Mucilaginibacter rubeus TaxID=2027860 RepID=A0AAE6JJT2_9SPHI|nr:MULTISPECIES: DUF6520 family protein [Mucilaginibacter]QEM07209.1 hypothetical protein DIU31_028295 [Mucilaginibacter rubeus]QEM19665.1 hypothetical protein DIU38_027870 [Mucilaginibacter gossypii]QTE43639.1 hypothetical protein J3L19_32760 [Mucilaginibacter rubeus]QTE50239.1 hypothetical protein J3L21_32715 [Mucilaginibacter rubeus]QTE55327.1 hypothetical protein J3L23_24335 [Mucilaginibacter rubeus]